MNLKKRFRRRIEEEEDSEDEEKEKKTKEDADDPEEKKEKTKSDKDSDEADDEDDSEEDKKSKKTNKDKNEKDSEEKDDSEDEDTSGAGDVPAAPGVRRLARELGVNINKVEGSGEGGRISKQDVKDSAKEQQKKWRDICGTFTSGFQPVGTDRT